MSSSLAKGMLSLSYVLQVLLMLSSEDVIANLLTNKGNDGNLCMSLQGSASRAMTVCASFCLVLPVQREESVCHALHSSSGYAFLPNNARRHIKEPQNARRHIHVSDCFAIEAAARLS